MAQEQVHETILVRELADDKNYESLTGREFLVTAQEIRRALAADPIVATNICLRGEVRLTASDIESLGLEAEP